MGVASFMVAFCTYSTICVVRRVDSRGNNRVGGRISSCTVLDKQKSWPFFLHCTHCAQWNEWKGETVCTLDETRKRESHERANQKSFLQKFLANFSPISGMCVCVCVRCFFLVRSSFSDFYHRSICVCGAFISLTNVGVVVVVVVVCVVIRFELYNVVGRPQLPYSWADFLRVTTHEPWLCHKFCHIIPFHCVALFCVGLRFCCTRFGSVWFGLVFPSLSLLSVCTALGPLYFSFNSFFYSGIFFSSCDYWLVTFNARTHTLYAHG